MRSRLLPLTALVAVAAGCRSEAPRPAARALERDLTLVTPSADVQVASPIETRQIRSPHRTVRHAQQPTIHLAAMVMPMPTPAPAPAAAEPAEQPARDRELLPGKTVTLIPASTSASSGPDDVDEASPREGHTVVAGGGGTCRGRGRRPGIAAAPRPDFRLSY